MTNKLIKKIIVLGLHYSGLNHLSSLFLSRRLYLLGYHSISRPDNAQELQQYLYPNLSVPAEVFREQLLYMKKQGHTFINFSDLPSLDFKKVKKPTIIFFDDGFKDNLLNAQPILSELGIPATVFATVGLIGRTDFLWTLALRDCLRGRQTPYSIELLIKDFKSQPVAKRREGIGTIFKKNNFTINPSNYNIFLNWEEAKALSCGGFQICSHGVSHARLTELDHHAIVKELADSKNELEQKINYPVEVISYPHGRVNRNIIEAVAQAGYAYGINGDDGINSPKWLMTKAFELRRINIKPTESLVDFKVRLYWRNIFN